jgi:hypothetical protein
MSIGSTVGETVISSKIHVLTRSRFENGRWVGSDDIELVVPRHAQFACRYKYSMKSAKRFVLVYEHMGSKDEEKYVQYPHCEVLTGYDPNGNLSSVLDGMYIKLVQRDDDQPFMLSPIQGQVIDVFGKARAFSVKGTLIPVTPRAPLGVADITATVPPSLLQTYEFNMKMAICIKSYFIWLFSNVVHESGREDIDDFRISISKY